MCGEVVCLPVVVAHVGLCTCVYCQVAMVLVSDGRSVCVCGACQSDGQVRVCMLCLGCGG